MALAEELLESTVETHAGEGSDAEERDLDALATAVSEIFGIEPEALEALDLERAATTMPMTRRALGARS